MKYRIILNGDKIRFMVARKNKTLNWLAKKLKISQSYLSMALNGKKCFSPKKRIELQRLFGRKGSWDNLFVVQEEDVS